MRRYSRKGISSLKFTFSMLVLTPMLLGTGVTGVNMIERWRPCSSLGMPDTMYARGVDFSQPGNKAILGNIGSNLGLSTTNGQGSAVVILSALAYVDVAACASANAVDANGVPTNACTNYTKWVFTQRLVIGNTNVRDSNYGSPVTNGLNGVTVDATTGKISAADYIKKSGAVASFTGVNPYSSANSGPGLPSGQVLYLAEAAATGFNMPPFVSGAATYSWRMF